MKSVRNGMFETNSSSTHSITMCTKSDYDKFVAGELYISYYSDELLTKDKVMLKCKSEIDNIKADEYDSPDRYNEIVNEIIRDNDYLLYNEYQNVLNDDDSVSDTYHNELTLPSGETVVAFGYYGENR